MKLLSWAKLFDFGHDFTHMWRGNKLRNG